MFLFHSLWGFLILLVIVNLVIYFIFRKIWNDYHYNILTFLLSAGITLLLHLGFLMYDRVITQEVKTAYNIVSLRNNTRVEGSYSSAFTIGSGRIHETEYYFVMIDTVDGYKRGRLPVQYTYIKEFEPGSMTPHVDYTYDITRSKIDPEYYHSESKSFTNNYIYVPKGTIVQEFRIE